MRLRRCGLFRFLEYIFKKSKNLLTHEIVDGGRKVSYGDKSVVFIGQHVVSSYEHSVEAAVDFSARVKASAGTL